MGFRFRKSINLGGGARLNLSKSGFGFSLGVPGLRFTNTASGRHRTTYSIPGTGLSYVEESGNSRKRKTSSVQNEEYNDRYNEQQVSNLDSVTNTSEDELISKINSFKIKDKLFKTLIAVTSLLCCFIFNSFQFVFWGLIVLFAYLVYRNKKMLITVIYDNFSLQKHVKLNQCLKELALCDKLWLVETKYNTYNNKRNSGTNTSITRVDAKIIKGLPYYLSTNIECYALELSTNTLYFLPDRALLESKNNVVSISNESIIFDFGDVLMAESEYQPKDTEVVDYTWRYVNKNGSLDKRYKDNPRYPKCKYGVVELRNNDNIVTSLLVSCAKRVETAKEYYNEYRAEN